MFSIPAIFGKVMLWTFFFGGDKDKAAKAKAAPATFPSAAPSTLPAFTGANSPGWCSDAPLPPEVQARATELLATLPKGTHLTELTGGRWITYAAETEKTTGKLGIHAYRSVNCAPVPVVTATSPTAAASATVTQ